MRIVDLGPGEEDPWMVLQSQQVSSLGEDAPKGDHLGELGCQLTGLHGGLRGSGIVEKQTHLSPCCESCGPATESDIFLEVFLFAFCSRSWSTLGMVSNVVSLAVKRAILT